jgi:hypothetical protein
VTETKGRTAGFAARLISLMLALSRHGGLIPCCSVNMVPFRADVYRPVRAVALRAPMIRV